MSAHITTTISWPTQNQVVVFRGNEFLLMPETDDWSPGIALNMASNGISDEAVARTAIARFATALSWRQESPLSIDGFTLMMNALSTAAARG